MTLRKTIAKPDAAEVLRVALWRAQEILGLGRPRLARLLGVSEATLSRMGQSRPIRPDSKEGELALLFLRLYRSLDALVGGDDEKARAWFGSENSHLDGQPRELVCRVEGLVRVVDYLDAMRGKI